MHAGLQEVLSGLIQPLVLEKILMEATNVLQSKVDIDKEHKAVRALSEAAGCILLYHLLFVVGGRGLFLFGSDVHLFRPAISAGFRINL